MGRKIEVHTGDVYGRLTILKEVEPHITPSGQKVRMVLAQCSCGSDPFEVTLSNLRSGLTTSCGCLQKEHAKEASKKYNTYDLTGEYGIGWTSKGEPFYFDLEDYDLIKDYMWYIDKDRYVVTKDADTKKMIRMHRLVMNASEGMVIDHIFHETNDNRKSQLREVTYSQNNMNRRIQKNSISGVTGVTWYKQNSKWIAQIYVNEKRIYLGSFTNIEDAIQARLEAEKKYFGGFSNNHK